MGLDEEQARGKRLVACQHTTELHT